MKQSSDRISAMQASVIVMSCILGVELLTLPGKLARKLESADGWIAVILGGITSMIAAVLIVKLGLSFPGKTIFEYGPYLLGKWMGKLLTFLFWIYFVLVSAFEIRAVTEVVKLFLLEDTPRSVIMILLMCVTVYLIIGGISSISLMFEVILPFTLIVLLLAVGLSLKIFELDNLRPVLGSGFMPVLKAVPTTSLAFLGIDVMYILPALMHQAEKAKKAVIAAIGISMIYFAATFIVTIAGISVDNTASLTWPTISLVRSFEYPGVFFERYETLLIIGWVMRVFTVFAMFHYMSSLAYTHLLDKKFDKAVFAQIPFIFIIAMYMKDWNSLFDLGKYLGYSFYFFCGLLPLGLLLIAMLKGVANNGRKAR